MNGAGIVHSPNILGMHSQVGVEEMRNLEEESVSQDLKWQSETLESLRLVA